MVALVNEPDIVPRARATLISIPSPACTVRMATSQTTFTARAQIPASLDSDRESSYGYPSLILRGQYIQRRHALRVPLFLPVMKPAGAGNGLLEIFPYFITVQPHVFGKFRYGYSLPGLFMVFQFYFANKVSAISYGIAGNQCNILGIDDQSLHFLLHCYPSLSFLKLKRVFF